MNGAPRGRRSTGLRKIGLSVLDMVLLRGAVARWSYRSGLHGTLRITRHEIKVAGQDQLPGSLTLAFASDFHAGPTTSPEMFERVVDELIAHGPDVLLLGGDYVWCRPEYLEVLCNALSRFQPRLGTYAVLGNHDLWADDEHIARTLAAAGIEVLVNRNCSLPEPFECVSVCGIDDPWIGSADVPAAFRDAKPIRIFLTHSPDSLLLLGDERFDVGFAGHTHGGQVALPDGTQIVTAGGPLCREYGRGLFEIPGNGPLIVSRGVGCAILPIRINSDPELVLCTLRP